MSRKPRNTPEEQIAIRAALLETVTRIGPALTETIRIAAGVDAAVASWHLSKLAAAGQVMSRQRRVDRHKVRTEWIATPGREPPPVREKSPRPADYGIDPSDIEWMQKYRRRRMERLEIKRAASKLR